MYRIPVFSLLVYAAFAMSGTLHSPAQPALWSGAVAAGGGPTGEVPECTRKV